MFSIRLLSVLTETPFFVAIFQERRLCTLKSNARIVGRFKGYTLGDCVCKYCLYYAGKGKPCPLKTCCCAKERAEALMRERQQRTGRSFP